MITENRKDLFTSVRKSLIIFANRIQLIPILSPIAAVLLALLCGTIIIAASGVSPLEAYWAMARGAFGNRHAFTETLVKASPLLLAGLGTAIAFKANIISIGAEGQLHMGALGAAYIGLHLREIPAIIGVPATIFAGILLGSIWGGIVGFMKVKFHAYEIIVSLMLNYIAIELVGYLVSGPWKDPAGFEPFTANITIGTRLPILLPGTRLHLGILLAFISSLLLWFIFRHTVFGYQVSVLGENKNAAKASGIRINRLIILIMLISGGLSGLAGVGELAGTHHRLLHGISPGYGYTAIAITQLGQRKPIGVMVAAFLFAALVVGADGMRREMGIPVAIAKIIEGLVLVFVITFEVLQKRYTIIKGT